MSFPSIHKTLSLITEIENKIFRRDLRQLLMTLLKYLQDSIKEIEIYLQCPEYSLYKIKIKLCISQMLKVIPALIHLLSEGRHAAFEDVADYMLEKLRWCLMEPMRMISGGGVEEDTEASGIFVKSIDWAISSLQAGEPINENYKHAIEDLLCQALTIAKLSSLQDYNEISSGCRQVLVSLSPALNSTCNMESSSNLKRDILLCSLETLYRRVNTSVLRLFLYVMSDSFLPLKNIIVKCVQSNANNLKNKQPNDLDNLITKLDLYLEQIHLLGNFAIACTDNWETKLRVQCSLASLEFCESHLIPAITAFYMDNQLNKRDYLSFLTDEAQKSLKDLLLQIDNIVDTGSFARVVFEDLADLTRTLRENVSDGSFEKKQCDLFHRRCNKLIQHLMTSDDIYIRQDDSIHDIIKKLLTTLKNQSDHLRTSAPAVNFILWSFDLALETLDSLCKKLNFSTLNHSSIGRISIDRTVNFADSITNLTVDLPTQKTEKNVVKNQEGQTWPRRNSNNLENDETNFSGDNPTLEPYLNKVGESPMIKSTLYCRTPLKTPKGLRHEHTSYKINDILEEIAKLPEDSWVSYTEVSTSNGEPINNESNKRITKDVNIHRNVSECSSVNVPSDYYHFDSPERFRDLIFVKDKINQLKET